MALSGQMMGRTHVDREGNALRPRFSTAIKGPPRKPRRCSPRSIRRASTPFVHQWPTRSRERAAMQPLCEWVRQGKLPAAEFITHEFPVERIAEAVEAVLGGEALKVVLRY